MKQLLQSLKNGQSVVTEVPVPIPAVGEVLIRTTATLVSAGTERMILEFGKGSLLQKVRQQPEKLQMVLAKAQSRGLVETLTAVRSKLDHPVALGYCNVGTVVECRANGFALGDRVVSNGKHAEVVAVPKNLCARVPDGVRDEDAAFTTLAAIALQSIRLSKPTIGECFVVIGLGLIGLLTIQLLKAQGCRVLGIDVDQSRLQMARQFGAETWQAGDSSGVVTQALSFSRGAGVDGVIIAATTKRNDVVSQAARMCRKRGRIVLVGVVGLKLNRSDFYEKELSFQVSCSYGPGRYDPNYEEGGNDYPIGYVRWTEQRNFEAVLDLMASGAINVAPLISHRLPIDDGEQAMQLLSSEEKVLGIVLTYPQQRNGNDLKRKIVLEQRKFRGSGVLGVFGAGNYAGRTLIPAFLAAGAKPSTIVSKGGVSAAHYGKKFGFSEVSTDPCAILDNERIDIVVIATRHNEHANQTVSSLRAGKHVFCEKPLCLSKDELSEIEAEANRHSQQHLMVGFNRRFSPHIVKIKSLLDPMSVPKCIVVTVNAGEIARDHWIQQEGVGGGRIKGEVCHFIDLVRHLVGKPIKEHRVSATHEDRSNRSVDDNLSLLLEFEDGSIGTVHYFANGSSSFPKEHIEIFAGGRTLQLDNFRKLRGWGWPNFRSMNLWRQDKGQSACVARFLESVRVGAPPAISRDEIFEVSRVTLEIAEKVRG